jgi:anti-sigma regulatory factor (Ser/Thr protein kinase)
LLDQNKEQIRLFAKMENLNSFTTFITGYAAQNYLDEKKCHEVKLATDEIITNIIQYAYPKSGGDIVVTCNMDPSGTLSVEIVDEGVFFNPLEVGEPDIASKIEEMKIGGLGISVAKRMVDDIEYRREHDRNILTLYKKSN